MRKPLLFLAAGCLLSALSFAQSISLLAGSTYSQNFDALSNTAGTTTNVLSISGWYLNETGGGARDNEQYAVDAGASNTGDTYSYGAAGATERALGSLRSGTLVSVFGASFTNNTGITLTSITITYTGEQWRLGTASRTDQLDFSFSSDATSLTTGIWTDANGLDFVSPVTTTVGAKDGNATGNRTAITSTINGLSIPNGATVWIRWSDADASSADDGLAIDDFTISTNASILPVKLTDFSVAKQQQAVVASWATLTETNSKQFELQRSTAGSSSWTTVATVTAQGNSNSRRQYKAVDAQPLAGTALYRIKSIDLDGSFTYSAVQQLTAQATALQAKLYPNPASQQVFVQLADATSFKGWLQISNNNGQVLLRRQVTSSNGQVQVPIQQLSAGMYSVQLVEEASGKKQTLSLIVK